MSKRKILALALTIAMIAILAVGGSLAYFTADDSAANTFTLGNISIEIEEQTYTPDKGYQAFDENQRLYPASNEKGMTFNKIVKTYNTSTNGEEAYIRTIVLFEALPNHDKDCCSGGVHFGFTNADWSATVNGSTSVQEIKEITIKDKNFVAVVFEDLNDRAIAQGSALASLHSVWLDEDLTQKDVAGFGDEVEVYVLSQAIQAKDLTHAQAMDELGALDADAVEELFGVKVAAVNTINMKSKTKRLRYQVGHTASWKKAIVTLKADSKAIEFFEGLN